MTLIQTPLKATKPMTIAHHALDDGPFVVDDGSTVYAISEVDESMQDDAESTLCSVNQDHVQEFSEPLLLLAVEADPKSKDTFGPALLQAIRGGYVEVVRKLLESGANPDAKDNFGPALTQAIRGRYEMLAIELVKRGADPDSKDNFGPALTQASRGGLKKLEKELLEQVAIPSSMTQESSGSGQSAGPGIQVGDGAKVWLGSMVFEEHAEIPEALKPNNCNGKITEVDTEAEKLHGTCKLSQATKQARNFFARLFNRVFGS